jgi:hypothetical protein
MPIRFAGVLLGLEQPSGDVVSAFARLTQVEFDPRDALDVFYVDRLAQAE